jgi:Protein of unknown function (DUF1826)
VLAAAQAESPGYHYRADQVAELTMIFAPQVQLCTLQRETNGELAAAIERHPHSAWQVVRTTVPMARAARDLQALNLPDLLRTDLCWLVEMYGDLLGCDAVGLRFEPLTRAMCPGFHIDQNGIRLICTYRGPGTEWTTPRPHYALPRDGDTEVERTEVFTIVLVKGGLWQGNAGRGGIHRSPQVDGAGPPRLVLTLDALWSA